MPNYDYSCTACGHTLEAFQKITEQALINCPSCHKDALRRHVGGGAALHFKGSGFYINDYKSDSCSNCSCNSNSPTE